MFKKRDLLGVVILSVLTVSLYWLYWVASTQNVMRARFGMKGSGEKTVFLIVITLGLYGIYWMWCLGKVVRELSGKDFTPFSIGLFDRILRYSNRYCAE